MAYASEVHTVFVPYLQREDGGKQPDMGLSIECG